MIEIVPLESALLEGFQAHFERHCNESGQSEAPFMPYARADTEGPKGLQGSAWQLGLEQLGWQRWFLAVRESTQVVGHVDLKGDGLRAGLHRCELGIGIEGAHRGQGLGRRLMQTAIDFAAAEPQLDWLDLRVFAHNQPARALYRSLGFEELGTVVDRFRIDGSLVDDVLMSLALPKNRK